MRDDRNIPHNITPSKRHMIKLISMLLCIMCLLLLLTACEDPTTPNSEFTINGPEENDDELACPNMDSQLNQLIRSEDPLEAAQAIGLTVKDGKLEVMLTLASEDASIPAGFDVEVSIRSGVQAQVFAQIDQLCDLSNTDEVVYIRVPEYGVPEIEISE